MFEKVLSPPHLRAGLVPCLGRQSCPSPLPAPWARSRHGRRAAYRCVHLHRWWWSLSKTPRPRFRGGLRLPWVSTTQQLPRLVRDHGHNPRSQCLPQSRGPTAKCASSSSAVFAAPGLSLIGAKSQSRGSDGVLRARGRGHGQTRPGPPPLHHIVFALPPRDGSSPLPSRARPLRPTHPRSIPPPRKPARNPLTPAAPAREPRGPQASEDDGVHRHALQYVQCKKFTPQDR